MKAKVVATLVAAPLLAFASHVLAASPVGTWVTIDDATKKPKSVVQISEAGGVLSGKVIKVLQSDKGPNPVCEACTGADKNKPIEGLTIVKGVKKNGNAYDGGTIMDPKSGKVYSVKMTPSADGKTMQVRGFMGVSLLGRTQVWQRQN